MRDRLEKIGRFPERRILWLLAASGLLLRVIFVLMTQDIGSPTSMDSGTYHRIAIHLLSGKGFSEDGSNPSVFVAPLYPFFIAAVYKVFGVQPLWVELLQCLLGTAVGVLTYILTAELFGRRPALIAFVLASFMPELFVLCTFVYTETLFIFLFLLSLLLAQKLVKKPGLPLAALAGFVAGLTTLTRGVTLLLPLLLLIALLFSSDRQKALRTSLIYGIFLVLTVMPWTIRNYTTFQAFVPIAVGTGDVFWTGNYLPHDGKYNYDRTMALMDSMTVGLNQVERDKKLTQEAINHIKAQPLATAGLMVRKFLRFWFWVYEATPTGTRRSANIIQWILAAGYYPILLFFCLGLWQSRKKWRELALLHGVLIYYTAIHVVMMVVPRYRFPIVPLLCLFAGCAIWRSVKRWAKSAPAPEGDACT